ncbi:hypothetical protein BESB_008730 [Besnoitia besnoiti]|uniref:Uncharacterized protein n=1 Tax=Besnoitia besnoiti TaxID=94643 RepID=A0A2A9MPD6_BESBE|nr:hypothetical protein BESB_008730 [Besnoitia besnoiti]PFH38531.1 hypothetical protein BESB_008730 [Besnoitia besnoiti]
MRGRPPAASALSMAEKLSLSEAARAAVARAVAPALRARPSLPASARLSTSSVGSAISNPLKRRRVREQGEEDDDALSSTFSSAFQSPVADLQASDGAASPRAGEKTKLLRPALSGVQRAGAGGAAGTGEDDIEVCLSSGQGASDEERSGEKGLRGKKRRKKRLSVTMRPGSPERLYYEVDESGIAAEENAPNSQPSAAMAPALAGRSASKARGGGASPRSQGGRTAAGAGRLAAAPSDGGADKDKPRQSSRTLLPSLQNLYVQLSDEEEEESPSVIAHGSASHSFPLSGARRAARAAVCDGEASPRVLAAAPRTEAIGTRERGGRGIPQKLKGSERQAGARRLRDYASASASAHEAVRAALPAFESPTHGGFSQASVPADEDTHASQTSCLSSLLSSVIADEAPFTSPAPACALSPSFQCTSLAAAGAAVPVCPLRPSASSPSLASFSSSPFDPHLSLARDSPWRGVPLPLRTSVAACVRSFGRERANQLWRLVSLLGDFVHSVSPIEVVGLPGTGKSHLLLSFFGASSLAWGYVDCAAACATAGGSRLAARQAICGKLLLHLALQLRGELLAGLQTIRALQRRAAGDDARRGATAADGGPARGTEELPEAGGAAGDRKRAQPGCASRSAKACEETVPPAEDASPSAPPPDPALSPLDSGALFAFFAGTSCFAPPNASSASPFASAAALQLLEEDLKEKRTQLDRLLRQMQSGGKKTADTLAFSGTLFSPGASANSVEQFVSLLRQVLRCSSPLARTFTVPLVIDEAFTLAQNMPDLLHAFLRLPELLGGEPSLGRPQKTAEARATAASRSFRDGFCAEDDESSSDEEEEEALLLPPRNVSVVVVGRTPLRPEVYEGLPQPPRVHFGAYEASEARDILVRSFRWLGLPVLRLAATRQSRQQRRGASRAGSEAVADRGTKEARKWRYGPLELVEQRTVVAVVEAEHDAEAEAAGAATTPRRGGARGETEDGESEVSGGRGGRSSEPTYVWESRLVLRRIRRRVRKREGAPATARTASAGQRDGLPDSAAEGWREEERDLEGEEPAVSVRTDPCGAKEKEPASADSCLEAGPAKRKKEASSATLLNGEGIPTRAASCSGGDELTHNGQHETESSVVAASPSAATEALEEETDLLLDVETLWSHFVTLFIQSFHQSLRSDFHDQRFLCREFWGQAINLALLQNRTDAGSSALTAAATTAALNVAGRVPGSPPPASGAFGSFAAVKAASVAAASFLVRLLHPHFRAALRQPFSHFLPDLQNCQILDAKHVTVWGASAQNRHTAARRLELPRLGKILLVAAAIAAYTPPGRDKRHFNDCCGNIFRVARPRNAAALVQSPFIAAAGAGTHLASAAVGTTVVAAGLGKGRAGLAASEKLEQNFLPRALPKSFTLLRWLALAECLEFSVRTPGRERGRASDGIGLMDAGVCQQVASLLRLGLVRLAAGGAQEARGASNGGYGSLGVLKSTAQIWGSEWTNALGWVFAQQQLLAAQTRGYAADLFLLGASSGGGGSAGAHLTDLFNANARLALSAPIGLVKHIADRIGVNLAEALLG